jgi:ribulose bisphosphate carboxylase small subunit
MTADYNGWNDAPEAEREAMDLYFRQESQREALAELKRLRKSARQLREYVRTMGYSDLRPAA